MQIREQGKKIQLIRTHYSPEKKRTEGKVFGSFDKYLSTIPDDICRQLAEEEVEQLKNYLSKRQEKQSVDTAKSYLSNADYYIRRMTEALSVDSLVSDLSTDKTDKIYQAMDELRQALMTAGYPQPASTKQPRPKPRTAKPKSKPRTAKVKPPIAPDRTQDDSPSQKPIDKQG